MGDFVKGTCPNCYGTKLIENLDELSCVKCGYRIEGHLSQLNMIENTDNFSGFKQVSQSQSYSLQLQQQDEQHKKVGRQIDGSDNRNRLESLFSRKRPRQQRLEKSDVKPKQRHC